MEQKLQWEGFAPGHWNEDVNVRDFIQRNYTEYQGDASFLEGPTDATETLWNMVQDLQHQERAKGGVLDMETEVVSSINAYGPAYIGDKTKELEKVVGLQTDKPLKRAFMPYGGIKMAEKACQTYGYTPNPELHKIFTDYHKTHNQAVFDVYTPEMKLVRHNKILTGLPDAYGRGRIVGDYRRVALYGIDFLLAKKEEDLAECGDGTMTEDVIRLREEIADQMKALREMKQMAASFGFDISQPAKDAKEAVQWLYFGYLAAIRTQNGAAMSVGRISTFLDIYIERDLRKGILTETEAQELIDHLVISVLDILLDAGADVVCEDDFIKTVQRRRCRRTLPQHIDAVGILLYHALYTPDLSLYPREPVHQVLFLLIASVLHLPGAGCAASSGLLYISGHLSAVRADLFFFFL